MRDDPSSSDNFFENGLYSHQHLQHNSNNSGNSSAVGSGLGGSALRHSSANASKQYSMSPALLDNSSLNVINQLRGELAFQSANKTQWEDQIMLASKACEVWRTQADASNRKVCFMVVVAFCAIVNSCIVFWVGCYCGTTTWWRIEPRPVGQGNVKSNKWLPQRIQHAAWPSWHVDPEFKGITGKIISINAFSLLQQSFWRNLIINSP